MDENPRVMTTNGPVQGIRQGDVNVFKGLRYAAPPKGELRWKPPVLPEKWTETAQATSFGPACPQQPDKMFGRLKDMDEDCLFLNVWAPKAASGAPVIVWLHGGSFVSGKGSQGIFDGYWLAESGAVVVTLNYRLGPFGFLAHPLLTDESEHGTSGNYGLLDQQMALEWVRDNISAFGGDPGNVSLFGQSSGAISACVHMTRPQTEGLFHRVLAMSAFVVMGLRELDREFRGLSSMHSKGEEFFEKLGVRNLDEARAVSQEALLNADKTGDRMVGSATVENLTVDGHVLRGQLSELFAYGHQRPLPFITGTTRDEGASFVKPMGIRTAGDLRKLMQDNSIAQQAMRLVGDVEITDDNATEMASELITRCFELSADFLARSMTLSAPTRMYRFDRHSGSARRKELGVHHGCELRYVFGNLPTSRGYSSVDREISNRLRATLLQFARGEQNLSVDGEIWRPYKPDETNALLIDREFALAQL